MSIATHLQLLESSSPLISMPFPHFDIADFPHVEITGASVRKTFTIGLGLVQIVLGVIEIVRGFQQSNKFAVCSGLKLLRDGATAVIAVVRGQETRWEDVTRQVTHIIISLAFAYEGVDDLLFKMF